MTAANLLLSYLAVSLCVAALWALGARARSMRGWAV